MSIANVEAAQDGGQPVDRDKEHSRVCDSTQDIPPPLCRHDPSGRYRDASEHGDERRDRCFEQERQWEIE